MDDPVSHPLFVRNLQAGQLRETFLVSAVASLLGVRFFLSLTGFPRIGGGGLHIAHMLWGGGLMVMALLFLLAYLGQRIRRIAAVLGGLGFGLFIDELGKFITSDNNYFYRPTIALIYVVFVLFFLRLRTFERHRGASEDVYLANALVLLQDAAIHDLDPKEKGLLVRWLRLSGASGTGLLGNATATLEARPPDVVPRGTLRRWLRRWRRALHRGLRSRWTGRIAVPVLLVRLLGGLLVTTFLTLRQGRDIADVPAHLPLLLATGISTLLALMGVIRLPLSRMHALRWFKRSVLATILLTDLFVFYYEQFGGLSDLLIDLVLLAVFDALIDDQHRRPVAES
ncbi:MAG: hypothetical protein M3Z13_03630 [Candidatus Dormibacteraeota bacterium]|nr:hypothetical protein [Candidatus Dormibacteraeota bacterium]